MVKHDSCSSLYFNIQFVNYDECACVCARAKPMAVTLHDIFDSNTSGDVIVNNTELESLLLQDFMN